jgi:hypothetical protein
VNLFVSALVWTFAAFAMAPEPFPVPADTEEEAPLRQLEFSFGSALLFADQPLIGREDGEDGQRMVAVSSVMMLGEYLFNPRLSLGSALIVPTTPRKRVVGGEIVEDHAPSSLSLGLAYKPVIAPILDERALFQLQLGLLVGRTIRSTRGNQSFPLLLLRPAISTPDGFSMYLGSAFAFQLDTLVLIYGVSQRF